VIVKHSGTKFVNEGCVERQQREYSFMVRRGNVVIASEFCTDNVREDLDKILIELMRIAVSSLCTW
jgi:hypothetical protein